MIEIQDEIIRLAATGDQEAFEKIYRAFGSFVYGLALRVTAHSHDAQEVTQEVFVQVFRQLKTFRYESSLKTWIYRIAVNQAINYAKKGARHHDVVRVYGKEIVEKNIDSPDEKVKREDDQDAIQSMINQLSEDQRVCLVLRSMEKLSYQEIADVLNIKVNTVRTRLKRAREKLLFLRQKVVEHEI